MMIFDGVFGCAISGFRPVGERLRPRPAKAARGGARWRRKLR
jgi:hypothetical protein